MKNGLLAFLAFLALTSVSAASVADIPAAEAAVRKADADWTTVAGMARMDAWVAFYGADAIVLLPHDQLASGEELLRDAVTRLLALPHLSVAWHPMRVEVARSGDLAVFTGVYELRYADSHGAAVSDRGRRLELWRKQAGTWKCIVDTWSPDEPLAVTPAAPETPVPAAAPASAPPTAAGVDATKYGAKPTDYQEAIRRYFEEHLKHPDSVRFREITQPEQGFTTKISGGLLMSEKREYGWTVKATIDAKNSHDRYVGFKTYVFLFRGEKIIDTRLPFTGDEMN